MFWRNRILPGALHHDNENVGRVHLPIAPHGKLSCLEHRFGVKFNIKPSHAQRRLKTRDDMDIVDVMPPSLGISRFPTRPNCLLSPDAPPESAKKNQKKPARHFEARNPVAGSQPMEEKIKNPNHQQEAKHHCPWRNRNPA